MAFSLVVLAGRAGCIGESVLLESGGSLESSQTPVPASDTVLGKKLVIPARIFYALL